jgi:glycosyltransferase involved in cell wall biosynthesis
MLDAPYFSICIPQYNRSDFLIEACRSFASQSFDNFEVCISDDCSTDGKQEVIQDYLKRSGIRFSYRRNSRTLKYDGNLRSAIEMSAGRYVLLMGNDDALTDSDCLAKLHREIEAAQPVSVAIANYRELSTGRVFLRMSRTEILGSGPEIAVRTFRDYSFLSGIALDGDRARALAADVVDGSEMYQMYLGARIVSEGGRFLSVADVIVDKDLQIKGQAVDSYRSTPRLHPCPITKRRLPMGRLLEVVSAGIRTSLDEKNYNKAIRRIGSDLYTFTYPFWAIEFKRVQSWNYALGFMLAVSPAAIAAGQLINWRTRVSLWLHYSAAVTFGLLVPIAAFDALRARLYLFAKRRKS